MLQGIKNNIKQGINEGFFRKDINIEIISMLHVLKIESVFSTDIFDKTNFSAIDIFQQIFISHFYGIANQKGIECFKKKFMTALDQTCEDRAAGRIAVTCQRREANYMRSIRFIKSSRSAGGCTPPSPSTCLK